MKTGQARHTCLRCGHTFSAPHLGDFVYGVFLLWSESGAECAYLNTLDAPEFDEVSGMLRAMVFAHGANATPLVQAVFGEIASDPASDGTSFSIVRRPKCPACGASDDTNIDDATFLPAVEVDVVTFRRWRRMSDPAKRERVQSVLAKCGLIS